MNRRGFFGTLLAAPVAVAGAKAMPPTTPGAPVAIPASKILAGVDDIVVRALRLLGLLRAGEVPTDAEFAAGHVALMAMMKDRCQKGMPLPSEEDMAFSLALLLAPEYCVAPSRYVVWRALQAERER